VGKLNLVDLAGSERQSKTGATGKKREQDDAEVVFSHLSSVIMDREHV
jgi:hypothetical protein